MAPQHQPKPLFLRALFGAVLDFAQSVTRITGCPEVTYPRMRAHRWRTAHPPRRAGAPAPITGLEMPSDTPPTLAVPVDRYRALLVAGRDALSFLQGQLTVDLHATIPGRLALTGLLSPQGRVIATPWLWVGTDPAAPQASLLLPASLAAAVTDRLRRYVLRAKATLSLTDLEHAPREALIAALSAHAPAGGPDAWSLALVRAGHPEIGADTSEEWIAQMLNLDLLGAIGFAKGCYTGQEIVARTQHLGRIKRRMFRYIAAGTAPPPHRTGLHRDGQKVGEVVLCAATNTGSEFLAVVNLDARGLTVTLDGGAQATPASLPYPVP